MIRVVKLAFLTGLLLTIPAFAEIPWGTHTQGSITLTANKAVWNAAIDPVNPHAFVYLLFQSSDPACGMYHLSVTYLSGGISRTEQKDVYAAHYSDYGHTGADKNQQAPVHTGFALPVDAEVTALSVTAVQLTTLGTAALSQ